MTPSERHDELVLELLRTKGPMDIIDLRRNVGFEFPLWGTIQSLASLGLIQRTRYGWSVVEKDEAKR